MFYPAADRMPIEQKMDSLTNEKCVACRRESPALSELDVASLKNCVPEWKVVERESIRRLERTFQFRDFAGALRFTNAVGTLAESEGHHPAILTEWGRVTVTLWTHAIGGLHRNDFILAAKVDGLG